MIDQVLLLVNHINSINILILTILQVHLTYNYTHQQCVILCTSIDNSYKITKHTTMTYLQNIHCYLNIAPVRIPCIINREELLSN